MSKPSIEKVRTKAVTRRGVVAKTAMAAAAMAGGLIAPNVANAGNGGGNGGGNGNGKCFLRGTRISTIAGERKIEDLGIGDMVATHSGGARPIEWIGRFRRIRRDLSKPWVKDALPVRIARSALAPNVPSADLYVTQGHALLIDGLLIPAGGLVNDVTITVYTAEEHDELEFFHIKLESHDVIYAEGTPCETLLQVDETMSNFAGYLRKFGGSAKREVRAGRGILHRTISGISA
ncbi:Hint domain-containing protein [Bradyrhizobium erythrophlei]|uniref:Hint domain-containing protein n=1 Tax=Bradyrhizobium erythrophlei TaxID=1437360 RepID=UPI0035EEAE87